MSFCWSFAGPPARASDHTSFLGACWGVIIGPPKFQPLWILRLISSPRRSASQSVCLNSLRHSGLKKVGPWGAR